MTIAADALEPGEFPPSQVEVPFFQCEHCRPVRCFKQRKDLEAHALRRHASTHAALVMRAAQWLRGTMKCVVVATERQNWRAGENPDAIGWLRDGRSILVECKTSREDFRADQRKPHRKVGGMGAMRVYLAPPATIPEDDLVGSQWGLLELRSNRVTWVRPAPWRPVAEVQHLEVPLLVAFCRRACGGSSPGVTVLSEAEELARRIVGPEEAERLSWTVPPPEPPGGEK